MGGGCTITLLMAFSIQESGMELSSRKGAQARTPCYGRYWLELASSQASIVLPDFLDLSFLIGLKEGRRGLL